MLSNRNGGPVGDQMLNSKRGREAIPLRLEQPLRSTNKLIRTRVAQHSRHPILLDHVLEKHGDHGVQPQIPGPLTVAWNTCDSQADHTNFIGLSRRAEGCMSRRCHEHVPEHVTSSP